MASYSSRSSATPSPPAVATREINGFVFHETRYRAGYAGGEHRHPTGYLGYVVTGDFTETCRNGRFRYGRGSLHFHPPGDPHAGVVGENGARSFSIVPSGPLAARLDSGVGALQGECPRHIARLAGRCHRGFLARDSASDLECEGAALELLAALLRFSTSRESGAPKWLFVARDYLHARACDPVTLTELAAVTGVHAVHLARVFRRRLGMTPAEYVRQLRLEIACQALATGDQPIADVALEAGYSSQSHLTRAFRAHFGATPASYRRARRSSST